MRYLNDELPDFSSTMVGLLVVETLKAALPCCTDVSGQAMPHLVSLPELIHAANAVEVGHS